MSIARCPACLTAFRVGAEQLALRGGRVRCGHCYRPFNALDHLLPDEEAEQAPAPAPAPAPTVPAPEREPLEFEIPERFGPPRSEVPPTPAQAAETLPETHTNPRPEREELTWGDPEDAQSPDPGPENLRWKPVEPSGGVMSLRNPLAVETPQRRNENAWVEPSLDSEPDLPPPATASVAALSASLEDDPDVDRWRTSAYDPNPPPQPYRWLWALGIGVLLGTLIAQASFIYREPITRQWPQLRPVYLEICSWLGCEVALPRVINGFNVASTRLEALKDAERHYVLEAQVVNTASHPQQFPYLELSLRDKDDQLIARRAFPPREWMPPDARLEQGIEAGGRLSVSLPFAIPETAVPAGFRVNLFYP